MIRAPEPEETIVECPECSNGLIDDGDTCDICGGQGILEVTKRTPRSHDPGDEDPKAWD